MAAQLHLISQGTGPPVVFLHGFLASGQYWQPMLDALPSGYRYIRIDLLGFGKSPKPARNRYGYKQHITALANSLQRAGIEKPVVLVGHSMGCLVAMRYALQYPERVQRLVLFNPPLLRSPREAKRTYRGTSLLYRLGLTAGWHRLIWPLYRLAAHSRLLGSALKHDTDPFRAFLFQHTARSRYRSFKRLIVHSHGIDDLAAIRIPTLLVDSSSDRTVYRRNLQRERLDPVIQVVTVAGDHHVPLKQPLYSARLLATFLSS